MKNYENNEEELKEWDESHEKSRKQFLGWAVATMIFGLLDFKLGIRILSVVVTMAMLGLMIYSAKQYNKVLERMQQVVEQK